MPKLTMSRKPRIIFIRFRPQDYDSCSTSLSARQS